MYNFFHWHVYALEGTITVEISNLLCAFNPLNEKKNRKKNIKKNPPLLIFKKCYDKKQTIFFGLTRMSIIQIKGTLN